MIKSKDIQKNENEQNEGMKQLFLSLILLLMSVMVSMPASATTGNKVKSMLPRNIIVKQTTQFTDGRTLTLYYKKAGTECEVYSPCNVKEYDMSDATKMKSTSFEVVNKTEGKLYRKASIAEVTKLIKRLVNQYL